MNVIDLRTDDERMGALDFDLSPAEMADAAVYQAQLRRQRDDRNELDRAHAEVRPRPMLEDWSNNYRVTL